MGFQEKNILRAAGLTLGLSAVLVASQAPAQDSMQRVEITGSSIKRIVKEGALPVQIISKETIARTGATTIAELIQKLPAMQNFSIEATAVGSGSGGRVTASIHDLGSSYTLVLLNGRRMAPLQDSGAVVNLNSIPLAAVERVEVLTDGASALYGADAIAGVVNFILKKNHQGLSVEAGYFAPQHPGGKNAYASATYGVGDLQADRFNLLLSYRHDTQHQLHATQRDFGKTGYIPFRYQGQDYILDGTSLAAQPANVNIAFKNPTVNPPIGFNPYLAKNGKCAELNVLYLANTPATNYCSFDTAATVEIAPESKRDTLFASGRVRLSDSASAFVDVSLGRFDLTARVAANSAGVAIPVGSPLYLQYVQPYLTPAQDALVNTATATYRFLDWGTRNAQSITEVRHLVAGFDASAAGWDLSSALTLSRYAIDERFVGGFVLNAEFRAMLANRSFDPFALPGTQSEATRELIKNSLFKGSVREAHSDLKGFDLRASREVFTLPGGAASVGIGADYRELQQMQAPSTAAAQGMIYGFNPAPRFDFTRSSSGAFAELNMPVLKSLEMTAALRYDRYSSIKDKTKVERRVGDSQNATTYKVTARYQPTPNVLLRASYGTGFKLADQEQIASALVTQGVTTGTYICPAALRAERVELCRPGQAQYNQYRGGNERLSPEESEQFTAGLRLEPWANISFGADLWDVKMTNQVSAVSEIQAFTDPVKFRALFTAFTDPATGIATWAYISAPINIGRSHYRGIDWEATFAQPLSFGKLGLAINGTRMQKASYTTPGTDNLWTDNMNRYGINNSVTFKDIIRFSAVLESGAMTNGLILNYRNGYDDAPVNPYSLAAKRLVAQAIRLQVPSYTTIDYQLKYQLSRPWEVRGGIKNLGDRAAPMSFRTSLGHQIGYDPRYADALGRRFYVNSSYQF